MRSSDFVEFQRSIKWKKKKNNRCVGLTQCDAFILVVSFHRFFIFYTMSSLHIDELFLFSLCFNFDIRWNWAHKLSQNKIEKDSLLLQFYLFVFRQLLNSKPGNTFLLCPFRMFCTILYIVILKTIQFWNHMKTKWKRKKSCTKTYSVKRPKGNDNKNESCNAYTERYI